MPTVEVTEASAGTFGLALRGDEFHRADEAGGVAGRKQLFGIVAGATATAEFLRGRELDVEHAVKVAALPSRPPVALALVL